VATHKAPSVPTGRTEPLEDADLEPEHVSEDEGLGKSKIECICPGCGKLHVMKLRWIGRGVPRKFCPSCRDRQSPLDDEE
jgi:hypothetical protein